MSSNAIVRFNPKHKLIKVSLGPKIGVEIVPIIFSNDESYLSYSILSISFNGSLSFHLFFPGFCVLVAF